MAKRCSAVRRQAVDLPHLLRGSLIGDHRLRRPTPPLLAPRPPSTVVAERPEGVRIHSQRCKGLRSPAERTWPSAWVARESPSRPPIATASRREPGQSDVHSRRSRRTRRRAPVNASPDRSGPAAGRTSSSNQRPLDHGSPGRTVSRGAPSRAPPGAGSWEHIVDVDRSPRTKGGIVGPSFRGFSRDRPAVDWWRSRACRLLGPLRTRRVYRAPGPAPVPTACVSRIAGARQRRADVRTTPSRLTSPRPSVVSPAPATR